MENKTVPPAVNRESMDNRAEWTTPAIVDYDIEEATRGFLSTSTVDGLNFYS